MKPIAPGTTDDVFLNAAQASVLRAVGVGHNADFVNIIEAQKQVAGTGVVQVQEGIILFRAIQCKLFEVAGRPKADELPLPPCVFITTP
jgi:hypothetical protein